MFLFHDFLNIIEVMEITEIMALKHFKPMYFIFFFLFLSFNNDFLLRLWQHPYGPNHLVQISELIILVVFELQNL